MTAAEMLSVDCLGFARFDVKQCKAMVDMVKRTGKLLSTPPRCSGQGIVICGGGKYLSWSWAVAKWLRHLGCQLPIQVWYLGREEMPAFARGLFTALDTETVDTLSHLSAHPHRMLGRYVAEKKWTYAGWVAKNFAIERCPFEHVLYLDADCFPSVNPEELFALPEIQEVGSLFFSDVCSHRASNWPFVYCSLTPPKKEWEAGQKIVHKTKGWMGLRWANWLNEHMDTWGTLVYGDKETDHLGFRISGVPYLFSEDSVWSGWGISQRWNGKEYFAHAMAFKRGEHSPPWPQIGELFWEWERNKK